MRTLESYQAVLYFDHVFGYITVDLSDFSKFYKKIHFHLHANLKCYRIYFKMLSINENITTVLYMSIPRSSLKRTFYPHLQINQLWKLHCHGQPVGWEIISVRCWQEVFVVPESLVCHRQSHTSSRHSLQTETHR